LLSVKGSQVQELIGSDYNGGYGDGGYARHAPVGGSGIVADGSGGLYVLNGSYLRWISPSGTLHTVGGDHPVSPVGIAPAPNHQVYAAEASGDIYRVDHSGESHLIASNLIGLMSSLGSDPFGNIYIGAVQDPRQPSSILKISPTGTITMIAGGGVATNGASPDGTPAIGAVLISVSSVTYWHGRVVFTESDLPYPRVVAINADGRLATLASEGCACYAIPNWALTPAADGNLYFLSGSRGGWSSLERILPTGQVAEVAIGDNDGYASDAPRPLDHRLPHPALSLGAGPGNRLFIGEYQRVRMLRL
jgi:hypothetical protein